MSPGPIGLIYEQLGDLLSQQKKHADALAAYETALKTSPGRLNSLFGAAAALEQQGKLAEARAYYGRVGGRTDEGRQRRAPRARARARVAGPVGAARHGRTAAAGKTSVAPSG